jgi:hypothetical protein
VAKLLVAIVNDAILPSTNIVSGNDIEKLQILTNLTLAIESLSKQASQT